MAYTSRGIWYPSTSDTVRPASRDFRDQAITTNAAIDEVNHQLSSDIEAVRLGRLIPQTDNLDDYRTADHAGRWIVADGDRIPQGTVPFGNAPFILDVTYVNQAAWQQAWRGGFDFAEPVERKWLPNARRWTEWKTPGEQIEVSEQNAQRDVLLQRSRLRHGGTIGTAQKTVVGLSFDHGFANFRDYVLPHLIRLGLPASVAVNTSNLGTGENDGVSYAELQDWAINHGIELVNHSRSHDDATGDENIKDAILGSLHLLHQHCPEVTVDAYIMPGVSGNGYDGFGAGTNDHLWWSHVAGRTILQNHAVVTGALLGQAVPLDGHPVQTVDRVGWDYSSWATQSRQRIRSLHGTGMGIQVFMHPSRINNTIDPAAVVTMLEWLAAERDAGRIEVLTVSGFAWADSNSSNRFDLGHAQDWSPGTVSVDLAPLYEWARGSQWELTANVSTTTEFSVTDDTGLLDTSVTVEPGIGRMQFTIPASAQHITVSAGTGNSPKITPI